MNKRNPIFLSGRSILIGLLLLTGCSTAPVVNRERIEPITGVKKIFLSEPVVEYIDSTTGNVTQTNNASSNSLEVALNRELRIKLDAKQVSVIQAHDFSDFDSYGIDDFKNIYNMIRLRSPSKNNTQEESLSLLAEKTGASHAMFCRCRLYAGPSGYWNPMSGAIAADSSRIVIEGHLYDIKQCRIIWTRASQFRNSQANAQSSIPEMIDVLLTELVIK